MWYKVMSLVFIHESNDNSKDYQINFSAMHGICLSKWIFLNETMFLHVLNVTLLHYQSNPIIIFFLKTLLNASAIHFAR
jgi:hypothetical protein